MSDRELDRLRKLAEQKALFDYMTKAWLDEKYAQFGRWTIKLAGAFLFVIFLKFVWYMNARDLRDIIATTEQAHEIIK